MPRYALRYVPLLILALLLIPIRLYIVPHSSLVLLDAPSINVGSILFGVTTLSSNNVWAVGGSFQSAKDTNINSTPSVPWLPNQRDKEHTSLLPNKGQILHYSDNHWAAARVDAAQTALRYPLFSISLDSPTDGWAVGYAGALVHYDGKQWSTIPGANPAGFNNSLLGVTMLSPTDGWAVGYSGTILRYEDQGWIRWASPTTEDLHGIVMASAQEGWAVGNNGVILHYSQGTWRAASIPAMQNNLNAISLVASNEAWAVGDNGTILHLRDNSWAQVASLNSAVNDNADRLPNLVGVSMSSIRSGWIIGAQSFLSYSSEIWSEPQAVPISVSKLADKALLPQSTQVVTAYGIIMNSPEDGWVVGSTDRDGHNEMAMLHNQQGSWSLYAYP